MDPQPAEFFSLEGVVAMAAVLVAGAKLADWLLLKNDKKRLLDRVAAFGDYLGSIRYKQAQLALVRGLLAFLTAISVPWTLRKHPQYTGKADDDLDASEILALMLAIVSRPLQCLVAVSILGFWAVGWLNFTYVGLLVVFAAVLLVRTLLWLLHLAAVGYDLGPEPRQPVPGVLRWLEGSKLVGLFDALGSRLLAVSFVLTVAALEVGQAWWQNPQTTAWFVVGEGGVMPRAPLTLAVLNLPFDVLALMVTLALLRLALRRGVSITVMAGADILVTLGIALGLLVVLLAWPADQPGEWLAAAKRALIHFQQLFRLAAAPDGSLFPLYPLLFTPFAPIAFYLLLPLFIAVVLAPLLRLSAHICAVLHQKDQSPFMVFAVAVGGTMVVAKALWAWPWLSERLAPLFS